MNTPALVRLCTALLCSSWLVCAAAQGPSPGSGLEAEAGHEPVRESDIGCDVPQLRTLESMDLGDIRIPRGEQGYLSVSPRGHVANAITVLVRRDPAPARMSLCGLPDQEVILSVAQPELELFTAGGSPVARRLEDLTLEGDGILLERLGPDRWEGRLGSTGRATVFIGATLYFTGSGRHGTAGTDISINAEPR